MPRYASTIVLVASLSLLTACNKETQAQEETPPESVPSVTTLSVAMTPGYTINREFVGTVQAGQSANLGFELGGKVNALMVDVGDTVQAGDPLIVLDTLLLDTESQQLSAQLEQLDAQLDLIKNNLQRQRQLKKKGFSADSEIDSLTSQRDALLANIRQLDASLASSALRKDKSTIYAPYSGKISHRFVSNGDVVSMGAPTLTLLADSQKEAQIGIPVKALADINQMTDPTIRVGSQQYPAKLLNPGADIDMRSRTITLRFLLPEETSAINGELAYLQYNYLSPDEGFWMPLAGVTDGLRGMWNVYAAVPNESGSHEIARRSVQVLHADDKNAYVSGAIDDGELVVIEGLHRVIAGQQVQVLTE
ncbi:efflux transporter periplasmic adaptor subunit [Enterovibrio norvegicus FF-33]|uniref:Efflux transporter periplasmic adaptor subunit n=1 Tax=Enterovibrio norvegicus FF-454 TaxID=1185651 RepID=A0A1E5CBH7_9GAMM|nr:efflux RND transporter periplasmic adaptor subunit [Enterovibrio norvegicus]OEE62850.1 efflux transporter periplasmic adaptor subunit [Enterovibrio norvegicus FF-454]OEE66774.1 efflux transporter periplasmic adaptor subunit [Enterovibrio norvegicus FF-33]OEE76588.1 efflux transporter periplasmic adaptor subunit [Enterovibrio norvegicus FF-162]